jgi:hypothetical protein
VIPRHFIIALSLLFVAALAMGIYAWRMRGRAETSSLSGEALPVVAPAAGPTENVTLWVAYDDIGILRAQSAQIPTAGTRQQRAEELIRALIQLYVDKTSPHPLPAGSEVRSVYLVDPGLAVIDLNAALADGHRSGILPEDLTLASFIQTIWSNIPGIARVKILVEGKERETLAGHADLSNFFDVSAVNQLTSQLQSTP